MLVAGCATVLTWGASVYGTGWHDVRAPSVVADALTEAIALWQAQKTEAAFARARSVRDGTDDLALEGRASLLLGQWLARAGRYAEAVESLQRQLRTGTASAEEGHVWLGTTLLACGQPERARVQFRVARAMAEVSAAADRELRLARALYGIALAADLLGEELATRESLARARAHDREGIVRAACAGALEPPVLAPEHARYLCLLADPLASVSKVRPHSGSEEAAVRWATLVAHGLAEPWASRARWHAQAHDRESGAEGLFGEPPVRIAALSVINSTGGVSTPVVDAALQLAARARGLALQACVAEAAPRAGTRIALRARFSRDGRLRDLELARPAGPRWVSALECLRAELSRYWIVPAAEETQVALDMIFGR